MWLVSKTLLKLNEDKKYLILLEKTKYPLIPIWSVYRTRLYSNGNGR